MSFYTVTVNRIYAIGWLWMGGKAYMPYDLTKSDVENIGELTRENIAKWLDSHSGDFQGIVDFQADIGDFFSDWANDDSEDFMHKCMGDYEEEEEVTMYDEVEDKGLLGTVSA